MYPLTHKTLTLSALQEILPWKSLKSFFPSAKDLFINGHAEQGVKMRVCQKFHNGIYLAQGSLLRPRPLFSPLPHRPKTTRKTNYCK